MKGDKTRAIVRARPWEGKKVIRSGNLCAALSDDDVREMEGNAGRAQ